VIDNIYVHIVHVDGVRLHLWTVVTNGPVVYPSGYIWVEPRWNDIDRGNRRTRRKTCSFATLCATNPTWTDMGVNLGLLSVCPATNRLSHTTVQIYALVHYNACQSGGAVWGVGLYSLGHWDRGFESRSKPGCLCSFFCIVLSYVGRGLATDWSLVEGVLSNVWIRSSETVGLAPPMGGLLVPWGGGLRELFVWGTYLFYTKYGCKVNIYFGRKFVCLKYFTCQLVPVLAPNYKQHILSLAKLRKECY
jgi:hypothetical protein